MSRLYIRIAFYSLFTLLVLRSASRADCEVSIVVPGVSSLETKSQAQRFVNTAVKYYLNKNYTDAIRCFQAALDLNQSTESIVLFNIAQSFRYLGKAAQARIYYKRFLGEPNIRADLRTEAESNLASIEKEIEQQEQERRRLEEEKRLAEEHRQEERLALVRKAEEEKRIAAASAAEQARLAEEQRQAELKRKKRERQRRVAISLGIVIPFAAIISGAVVLGLKYPPPSPPPESDLKPVSLYF